MQAGCLVVHPGGRNNHTSRHAFRLLRTALDELLPTAEHYEVPLALEPMHVACAASWTFLTDFECVSELVAEYNTPYLKLALDTYHFPVERERSQYSAARSSRTSASSIWPIAANRRASITIAVRSVAASLPLAEILASLIESGYVGPFDVRLMGSEIQPADYGRLLEQSRQGVCRVRSVGNEPIAGMTSFDPLRINSRIVIPQSELRFSFVRSSGPGGQNVNKVNSKAQLRWSVVGSQSLPEDVRTAGARPLCPPNQRPRRNRADQPALPRPGPKYWRLPDQAARNASSRGDAAEASQKNSAAPRRERISSP